MNKTSYNGMAKSY